MSQHLRLALYCPGCMPGYHLPYFAAESRSIYERHGLTVELVDPEPGPENVRAAAAGTYDLCLTSVAYYLGAKSDDPSLEAKFVFMVARRPHMAAFCLDDRRTAGGRATESLEDLEGATVLGTRDSPFVREYLAMMDRLGVQPGALLDVPYQRSVDALLDGEGDVAVDHLDLAPAFDAAAEPRALRVRALPFYEAGLDVYGSGLVAGGHVLARRPDAVRRLLRTLPEALDVTCCEPGEGLALMTERFPHLDPRRAMAGWEAGEPLLFPEADPPSALGRMDAETWRRTIAFHADAHGTRRLAPEDVYDASFLPEQVAARRA